MANHNWYIGQDIVCIKTHSEGVVKGGEIFHIKSLKIGFCKCVDVLIDVGQYASNIIVECSDCNITIKATDNIRWLADDLFAPLDTLTDISEIEEILNQPIEQLFQI